MASAFKLDERFTALISCRCGIDDGARGDEEKEDK